MSCFKMSCIHGSFVAIHILKIVGPSSFDVLPTGKIAFNDEIRQLPSPGTVYAVRVN